MLRIDSSLQHYVIKVTVYTSLQDRLKKQAVQIVE